MGRVFLVSGALLGALGVTLGAFGAHSLAGVLGAEKVRLFETASRYQMFHSLALLAVGLAMAQWPASYRTLALCGWTFVAGILLFSGSLYAYAILGTRWLAMITPLGGVAFIFAWGLMAIAIWRA
jgi:uncharacterized membrane protein YgdD (TMEM256/DUF423 family)